MQRNRVGKEETMAVGAQSAEKEGLGRTGRKRREKIGNSGQELLRPQKTFHQRRLESGSFTHAKWLPHRSCALYFIFFLAFYSWDPKSRGRVRCNYGAGTGRLRRRLFFVPGRRSQFAGARPIPLFSSGHAGQRAAGSDKVNKHRWSRHGPVKARQSEGAKERKATNVCPKIRPADFAASFAGLPLHRRSLSPYLPASVSVEQVLFCFNFAGFSFPKFGATPTLVRMVLSL